MFLEISQVRGRLKVVDEENSVILSSNSHLIKQLSIVNESLFISEAKVEQLSKTLQDQASLQAKVDSFAARSQALESQITLLESVRESLKLIPVVSVKDRKLVESRWRKTELMLETLTEQYEKLEQEAFSEDILPGKRMSDLDPPPHLTTPMHNFINTILTSELESPIQPITTQQDEIEDLRKQLALTPVMSSLPTEIHHHHHFHMVQTPSKQEKKKKVSFTNQSMPLTPPYSAERTLRRISSLPDARDDDSDTCISESITSEDDYFDNFPLHSNMKNTVRKFMSYESGLRDAHDGLVPPSLLEAKALSSVTLPDVQPTAQLCTPDISPLTAHRHRTKRYSDVGTPSKSEVSDVSAEFTFSAHQQQTSPTKLRSSSALLSAAVANNARRKSSLVSESAATDAPMPSTPDLPQTLNRKLSSFFTKLRGTSNPTTPIPISAETGDMPPLSQFPTSSSPSIVSPVVATAQAFPSALAHAMNDPLPSGHLKPDSLRIRSRNSVSSLQSSMRAVDQRFDLNNLVGSSKISPARTTTSLMME